MKSSDVEVLGSKTRGDELGVRVGLLSMVLVAVEAMVVGEALLGLSEGDMLLVSCTGFTSSCNGPRHRATCAAISLLFVFDNPMRKNTTEMVAINREISRSLHCRSPMTRRR